MLNSFFELRLRQLSDDRNLEFIMQLMNIYENRNYFNKKKVIDRIKVLSPH